MNKRFQLNLLIWGLTLVQLAGIAQSLTIYTLAGKPAGGSVDGSGASAQFNVPIGVAADAAGNVYVADTANSTVRRVSPTRVVSTFAGDAGNPGSADGLGTNAQFYLPQGLALDAVGNLYVADTGNSTIRKITPAGFVTTIAGAAGIRNSFDGAAASARFFHPQALAVDSAGNVYVADTWNHTIRKITPAAQVSTLAGLAGKFGAADGTSSKARFNQPAGIALDSATNLFVTDFRNHTIRKITPGGTVTTVAGLAGVWGNTDGTNSAARFFQPQGIVASSAGDLFVMDSGNHTVRQISALGTNWVVSTIGGLSGTAGNLDGTSSAAQFFFPAGLALDGAGDLHVADSGNNSLRTDRVVPPLLRFGVLADQLILKWPASSINFGLENATSVSTGADWVALTNGVSIIGDSFVLSTNVSAPAGFYRLRQR